MDGHGAVLLSTIVDTKKRPIYTADEPKRIVPQRSLTWTAEDNQSAVLVAGLGWRTV